MSDLQAAKRGFRKVRPSLWISFTPSFLNMAWLLSDRCFCSRQCRIVGAGKQIRTSILSVVINNITNTLISTYKKRHILEVSGQRLRKICISQVHQLLIMLTAIDEVHVPATSYSCMGRLCCYTF